MLDGIFSSDAKIDQTRPNGNISVNQVNFQKSHE